MSVLRSLNRRERQVLFAALAIAIAIRVVYVIATKGHVLVGDEPEYHSEASFLAEGKWFVSTAPFGDEHQSTWKAPGYGTFLGLIYLVVGSNPDRAMLVQSVLAAPATILLTFLLARRLFSSPAGLVAAGVVAVYPLAWQYDVRLYSEVLATPLTTLAVILLLTWRRPAAVGAAIGACLLVRPSSLLLLPAAFVAFVAYDGLKAGSRKCATCLGVAVLVVAPWSIRNATLEGPWVPLSVQSAAFYGVFNDDAVNDPVLPYKWRPVPSRDRDLVTARMTDGEFYRELNARAFAYIEEHPATVLGALWHNGVRRLWDLRSPAVALGDVPFEGRTRSVTLVGLIMYYPLLLLALLGLRRLPREQVMAIVALALASSVVYLGDSGTRYRAPIEPLIVVLAAGALPLPPRLRAWLTHAPPEAPPRATVA